MVQPYTANDDVRNQYRGKNMSALSAADTGLPDEAEAERFALIAMELSPAGKRELAAKAEVIWGPDQPDAAKMAACLRELADRQERA